jgi:predicted transcriptional regulator
VTLSEVKRCRLMLAEAGAQVTAYMGSWQKYSWENNLVAQLIDPKQLKRIRVQLGYTQKSLAEAAGVSQSIVAKVEAGAVDPTFKTLRAISVALNSRIVTAGKKAADVMSSPVIGVNSDAKLSECVAIMKKNGFSQMPVFSEGRMIGTITEGWILNILATAPTPAEALSQRVGDHVQPVFAVVGRDTPLEALFSLFSYLPAVVVVSGEEVLGIITKIDMLTAGT